MPSQNPPALGITPEVGCCLCSNPLGTIADYLCDCCALALDDASPRRACADEAGMEAIIENLQPQRARDYGDELLEDVSNDRTGRKGWAWTIGGVDYLVRPAAGASAAGDSAGPDMALEAIVNGCTPGRQVGA